MMRPIFCGNFEFDARSSDLERLFRRYGKVDRVDMKSGFAFVYMEDERDAEYAIRALDRTEFGRKGRRLRVEWTKHERGARKPVSSKRSANLRPSKTLFVINFPYHTKQRDLEKHFDPYGKILNVRIRRNFAFVQYESQEDATKALEATNMSLLLDRPISVEYAARDDDDDRRSGHSPDRRGRDRSPDRRRRSPSPYKRQRGSPDYGAGSSPAAYRRDRGSPVYDNGSSRSPRRVEGGSPEYKRGRSVSPRRHERVSPDYRGRGRSRSRSPRGGERERSPRRVVRKRSPPGGERERSPRRGDLERSPRGGEQERSPRRGELERSPRGGERERSPRRGELERSPRGGELERSPRGGERERSPLGGELERSLRGGERDRSPRGERNGNGYAPRQSLSPEETEEGAILDDDQDSRSPVKRSVSRDRPVGEYASPQYDRYRSRSPVARERSQS